MLLLPVSQWTAKVYNCIHLVWIGFQVKTLLFPSMTLDSICFSL